MSIEQTIQQCHNLLAQPEYRKDYLIGIQNRFRGITGYFSNYIPQEVIAAAGFHPVRIIGSFNSSQSHQQGLFNPVCSFVQDMYAAAGSQSLSYFSNIIFPNSCDSLKVLSQIWNRENLQPPAFTLMHPIKTDNAAVEYCAVQMKAMGQWLADHGGMESDVAEDRLLDEIHTYNRTRNLLRQLYETRAENPECLSGSDLFTVMTAGLIMDRNEYNRILAQLVEQVNKQKPASRPARKRIMVIGPLLDNMELLKKIEALGACIVADEVTNGWRYVDRDVSTQGDPYENLARRYLTSGPGPTLNIDPQSMTRSFQEKVSRLDLSGVIFIIQKFCEPHVHNYVSKNEILTDMGMNTLMLEIEHSRTDITERDLLRIESFMEVTGSHI